MNIEYGIQMGNDNISEKGGGLMQNAKRFLDSLTPKKHRGVCVFRKLTLAIEIPGQTDWYCTKCGKVIARRKT